MADSLHQERRALAIAVRELRARKTLKQEEVAEAADLGRNYMTTLEGGRGNPTFVALVRLSRALGIPLSELIATYEQRLED
ncbi:helix-turn-helix transcriptional regulator [Conexibacter sp. JD483]|uniref:helix-turn-helix domain-containing protein n=1 Tax=unclassified Conexibacter TaxID=2627773 RepID=UPI002727E8B3|nr:MULTISPECIES: helix-turn-helix transcriptional regulator [unclassified Conexibacter]MDO8185159.1 helix-turn-helix transcriptional regulator [Conexibacter sp. CPCC 205706]MDO8196869.1 helix-turn-helix transcriptional regulator [Conexibacter sp. CPCC 205762]MDR9368645.1 helix-turn-helix transcriptional regulator [Conexibacter sp. JD483]